jgi:hypothetical protein
MGYPERVRVSVVAVRAVVGGALGVVGCAFGGDTQIVPCNRCDAATLDGAEAGADADPLAPDGSIGDGANGDGAPATADGAIAIPDAPIDARPCTGGNQAIFDPTTGHCYLVYNTTRQWQSAADFCLADGTHLVTISSAAENELVRPSSGFRWIGLEDIGSEGTFTWVTGEPLSFTNWNGGEPNGGGGENCGGMLNNGRWNDFQCGDSWAFVCEFP